ncbi:MAG: hypothetical protein J1F18_04950 [Lachnospiraceae bacterium]|nr:hypothetical protein [Lachnospiraceae bacterium]
MFLEAKKYRKEVSVGPGIEVNGEIWCVGKHNSKLYAINANDTVLKYEKDIDIKSDHISNSFFGILHYDGYLYLVPLCCNIMVKFCLRNHNIEYFDFTDIYTPDQINNCRYLFISSCQVDNYLYLFPYRYGSIVRFNTDNNQTELLPLPADTKVKSKDFLFTRRCAISEEHIFIAQDKGSSILQLNIKSEKMQWINLPDTIHIQDICLWKEEIFILDISGEIFTVSIKDMRITEILNVNSDKFGFLEKTENYIWLIPTGTNEIIRCSSNNGVEAIQYPQNFKFSSSILKSGARTFSNVFCDENKMIIMPRCNNVLITIDKRKESVIFNDISCSNDIQEKLISDFSNDIINKELITESEGALELMLDVLINSEYGDAKKDTDSNIGEVIKNICIDS